MDFDNWALSAAVFIPAIGVLVMMLIPRADEELAKLVALGVSVLTAAVGVWILFAFDYGRSGELQFVVDKNATIFGGDQVCAATGGELDFEAATAHFGGNLGDRLIFADFTVLEFRYPDLFHAFGLE